MFGYPQKPTPAVAEEEKQSFLPDSKVTVTYPINRRQSNRALWLVTGLNLAIFTASVFLASYAYRAKYALLHNHKNAILRLTDYYSPVHDQAHIGFVNATISGSLLDMNNSIFRGPPSPELDTAWERIGSLMPHIIHTEDVIRLGKDPEKTARWPEDWGFGPDAHVAELDILHTIHCLNAIRRDIHWRYYFGDVYPDGVFPELHRVHTDHCIHIVLQNLMCSATADIITQPWADGQLHPFPDFSIHKKCRDFGAIVQWHEETMVTDMAKFAAMRMPEGHEPLPMSDEFHRMFGSDASAVFHDGHSHGEHGSAPGQPDLHGHGDH